VRDDARDPVRGHISARSAGSLIEPKIVAYEGLSAVVSVMSLPSGTPPRAQRRE
jgi:hypothetical protein